jgi:hypothetical protein
VGLSRLFVSRPKKASLDTPLLLLLTTHTRSCLRPAFSTALTPARPEAGGAFARDAPPPDHRDPPALSDSVASRYYPLLSLCFSAPPPPCSSSRSATRLDVLPLRALGLRGVRASRVPPPCVPVFRLGARALARPVPISRSHVSVVVYSFWGTF